LIRSSILERFLWIAFNSEIASMLFNFASFATEQHCDLGRYQAQSFWHDEKLFNGHFAINSPPYQMIRKL
jgi:hypothetical protein